jgi:hypothetical protein
MGGILTGWGFFDSVEDKVYGNKIHITFSDSREHD